MERSGIEPSLETFHAVVDRIAASGDIEGCKTMVYNMARKGFAVDAHINAASVFVFSVRGHYKKADSLCEVSSLYKRGVLIFKFQQAATKYGDEGSRLANGAAVRAAACRGDNDRLRQMLRKCVIESTKKLALSSEDILETIWQMAEKSRDGKGSECSQLVEQMLNCTMRDAGFFRKLFREIERHICHGHYYTALSLLEDTKRVSECLQNQRKSSASFLYLCEKQFFPNFQLSSISLSVECPRNSFGVKNQLIWFETSLTEFTTHSTERPSKHSNLSTSITNLSSYFQIIPDTNVWRSSLCDIDDEKHGDRQSA